jgi:flagellar hook-length control protein FliK
MQAVKPDAKTLASTDAAQTQRIDTAANLQSVPTAQTDTDGVTQTAKAPEAPGTDFVKDNVMRIVDKMGTQVSDGKYEFDMELKPDFLGKVNIKLSMQNGEIRMQIKTDDVNVKGMFADQVSSMQAVLKDKGITVTNIDVTYQSQMQTGEDRHSDSHSGNGKKQGSRVQVSLEHISGAGVFETMSQITGYTHGNSSVEYLA